MARSKLLNTISGGKEAQQTYNMENIYFKFFSTKNNLGPTCYQIQSQDLISCMKVNSKRKKKLKDKEIFLPRTIWAHVVMKSEVKISSVA